MMELYHEIPKTAIKTIIRKKFSDQEFRLVEDELISLVIESGTTEELLSKVDQKIHLWNPERRTNGIQLLASSSN